MSEYYPDFNPEFEKPDCTWCGYPLETTIEFKEINYICNNEKCESYVY